MRNISLNPIFQGVTVSQNSPSVPWGPRCFTKMTVRTFCTLALCQDKVFSLADCPYPNIEDVAVSLFSTHFLPKQGSSSKFSIEHSLTNWVFFAYLCIQKALSANYTHRSTCTSSIVTTWSMFNNYFYD